MRVATLFLALCCVASVARADAPADRKPAYAAGVTWLITPMPDIARRAGSKPVEALAEYMKRLDAAASTYFEERGPTSRASGWIIAVVRPGGRSRVWAELGESSLTREQVALLIAQLTAAEPLSVEHGPVAFSIQFDAWGGGTPPSTPPGSPGPVPAEWSAAARAAGEHLLLDDLLDRVWP